MIEGKKANIDGFKQYLAKKAAPSQLSSLYSYYSEIETFCMRVKVLRKPLFETTDFETVKKVQSTIEQNRIFRITHKRQFNKILAACRLYYLYIKERHFSQAEQGLVEKDASREERTEVVLQATSIDDHTAEQPLTHTGQDARLMLKYPIAYEQIYSTLKSADCPLSIGTLSEKIGQIARSAVLETILDNVSWAKSVGDKYEFSDRTADHCTVANKCDAEAAKDATIDSEIYVIDFEKDFDLAHSKPESFTYFGEQKPCGSTWDNLYVSVIAAIYDDYPHLLKPDMSFPKSATHVELALNTDCASMLKPQPVPGTDLMLETNLSANHMAAKIKFILELCNVDFENVVICYRKIDAASTAEARQPIVLQISRANSATFYHYLLKTLGMAEATCRSYVSAINSCESFARDHHFASCRLYAAEQGEAEETIRLLMADAEFQEYNAKQHNRFRVALQKYLSFIGSTSITPGVPMVPREVEPVAQYSNKEYDAVLRQYFQKGFRMESPLEIRKFRRYYSLLHEKELYDTDDEISRNISALSVLYDGKAFLPDVMLRDDVKAKLYAYIDSAFSDGKVAIYYQALYTEFAEEFLDQHIHDPDMLKAYLSATANGRYYIHKSFISKDPNVRMDPLSEIRDRLIAYGRPVEYEELFEALAHIPQSKIKLILASHSEFVNNGQGAYFHEKIVRLSDEELEGIAEIISQTIAERDFIGGNELYDAIKAKYSYIIEENSSLSMYGFRDALKAKLGSRFSFRGNIISRAGTSLSMADVFAKYAQSHDSFALSELQELASNLATAIYFDAIYDNSLRISREQFVSKAMAQFAVSETDDVLDRICLGKYIPICEVQNFGIFPYAGFTWNSYLLEHYVASYSHKYRLLHSGFNGTECAGAIVRRSAGIDTFDDLIVDILVNSPIELEKALVLQYLNDKGYLARRRYSEIGSLIIRAKAQKQRKDD